MPARKAIKSKKSVKKKTTKQATNAKPKRWSAWVTTDSTHPQAGLFNEKGFTERTEFGDANADVLHQPCWTQS
jgi:hypothetical protein